MPKKIGSLDVSLSADQVTTKENSEMILSTTMRRQGGQSFDLSNKRGQNLYRPSVGSRRNIRSSIRVMGPEPCSVITKLRKGTVFAPRRSARRGGGSGQFARSCGSISGATGASRSGGRDDGSRSSQNAFRHAWLALKRPG